MLSLFLVASYAARADLYGFQLKEKETICCYHELIHHCSSPRRTPLVSARLSAAGPHHTEHGKAGRSLISYEKVTVNGLQRKTGSPFALGSGHIHRYLDISKVVLTSESD